MSCCDTWSSGCSAGAAASLSLAAASLSLAASTASRSYRLTCLLLSLWLIWWCLAVTQSAMTPAK